MNKTKTPKDIPAAFQEAWDAHDMKALGSLFNEEATFVNRFGHYVQGVDEIISLHEPIHQTIYSDSTLNNELIDVLHISTEVAIVHFWSHLAAGAAHPTGPHEVDTVILVVLTQKKKIGLFKHIQNVTLTNPRAGEIVLREK